MAAGLHRAVLFFFISAEIIAEAQRTREGNRFFAKRKRIRKANCPGLAGRKRGKHDDPLPRTNINERDYCWGN